MSCLHRGAQCWHLWPQLGMAPSELKRAAFEAVPYSTWDSRRKNQGAKE